MSSEIIIKLTAALTAGIEKTIARPISWFILLVYLWFFVSLQQDAFDEVDSVTPMERQEEILNMVIDICHTEFKFDTFIEVMDYFKKMINLCKQMNYAKYKSEQYEDFKKQLQELVAERSVWF